MSSRVTRSATGRPQRQRATAFRAAQLVSQIAGSGRAAKLTIAGKRNVPQSDTGAGTAAEGSGAPAIAPTLPAGSQSHRDVRRGILSTSELPLGDVFAVDEGDEVPDLVSIMRFPPGIAAVLRRRLNRDFERRVMAQSASDSDPQSSRGPLGLSITPTTQEDYRIFDIALDLMTREDLEVVQTWHGIEKVNSEKYPPVMLPPPKVDPRTAGGGGSTRSSTVQGAAGSAPTSLTTANLADVQEPDAVPVATVKLVGILVELPTLLEVYKSLDGEGMAKSANLSQLLVVFFVEDELLYLPSKVTSNDEKRSGQQLHHCAEQVQQVIDQIEAAAGPDAALDALLSDPEKFNAPKCPWLWPSGLTAPMADYRERRMRDTTMFNKAEIHAAEIEMLNIVRNGRQEYAQLETASALEGYVQQEALETNSSIPQKEQVIRLSPQSILRYVIPDLPSDLLDDPPSDWSDQIFGDERGSDLAVLHKETAASKAAANRRKKQRAATIQEAEAVALVEAAMHIGGTTTLQDEFAELTQVQAEQQRLADLEAEFEAEFYSGAVVGESGSETGYAGGGIAGGESAVGSSAVGGGESPILGPGGTASLVGATGLTAIHLAGGVGDEGGLTNIARMTMVDKNILQAVGSKRRSKISENDGAASSAGGRGGSSIQAERTITASAQPQQEPPSDVG